MGPDRLLQRVSLDPSPGATGLARAGEGIGSSAAIVAPLGPAAGSGKAASVQPQPTDPAFEQAAQQVLMLLVAAEGHCRVTGQLGLSGVPGLLLDQRRHR